MKINNNNGVFNFLSYSNITDKLPIGNYNVMFDPIASQFYLTKKEDFKLPEKIYGDTDNLTNRYLKTFLDKTKTLGILLAGEKGSGKTLLAQLLCKKANLPVLFVDAKYKGPLFNDFIGNITQEIIIFFDEFEKVYDELDDKQSLLGILDGNFSTKKMFIFTCNTTYIGNYMTNRPSRVYYKKLYEGLTLEEIKEISDNELIYKKQSSGLLDICEGIGKVNIDLVRSLIEEMNRFNEPASEAFKYLNIDAEREEFIIKIISSSDNRILWIQQPLLNLRADGIKLSTYLEFDSEEHTSEDIDISLSIKDLTLTEEGNYLYKNPKDSRYFITIEKKNKPKNLIF